MSTVSIEPGFVATAWARLARHWLTIVQLLVVLAVVEVYDIEGDALSRVMIVTVVGFVVSVVSPAAYRLPLFTLLSLGAVLWVLGPVDGAFLILLGTALIGIANLPLAMPLRVAALVLTGCGMAVLRAGYGDTPWSSALWPILGSMFMFRMVLYLRALSSGQAERGPWGALAYFFMLPNVAFPLFPVVDYQTFRRTHFDKEEAEIYERGLLWISRGLVHLVLYRFVYYHVLNDPRDVVDLGDLLQFMLGTFLLYLRVSGQFHLIVGLLHLFGFRLPETHKLYYLAHSFTELWRRINIYWTEFMMKAVFYPTYFRVKKLGPVAAVVLATTLVFLATWVLHSYQWFWLRGGFPITIHDGLFWGILGAFVVIGAVKELRGAQGRKRRAPGWDWRMGLKAAVTFSVFCFLWSLWSTESIGQWVWMLGAAANPDVAGLLMLVAAVAVIAMLGGWDWEAKRAPAEAAWRRFAARPAVRTLTPLLVLILIAQPVVQGAAPAGVGATMASLQLTRLNAADAAAQHRGYYEQLEVRNQVPVGAAGAALVRPDDWLDPAGAGVIRERNDRLARDLYPSLSIDWNGNEFTTNEHGMRDRSYSIDKPRRTFRIALMGPSHVMGNGVADDETFENLVEDRLNESSVPDGYDRVEILNFGVDGYSLPQQLALLEDRVFEFSPDMVIVTQYDQGDTMTESYMLKFVSGNLDPRDDRLEALLSSAGLTDIDRGPVPVPFDAGRRLVGYFGIEPRMPYTEMAGRVYRIAEDVNDWAIHKIVEVSEAHGARAVMLALNVVLENPSEEIPNLDAIRESGMPLIDLFHLFSDEDKPSLRVAAWDDHPNADGHRLIADELYAELVPLLRAAAADREPL